MQLPPPASAIEDENVIRGICAQPGWEDRLEPWLEAYGAYREHGGNPWAVEPVDFDNAAKAAMYALYTSRRKSVALNAIRDTQLPSCPMCGSLTTGDLDHYLPRETFSEFSIMRANLVPACTHCNSSGKGITYKGNEPERFIHPYFDAWAGEAIWEVRIDPPYAAATFVPQPMENVGGALRPIVEFHLDKLLGKQFERSITSMWGSYPASLSVTLSNADMQSVVEEIDKEILRSCITRGVNAWDTAFYRGLRANPEAIEAIRERLEMLLAADV